MSHLFNLSIPQFPTELKDYWYSHPKLPFSMNELGGIKETSEKFRVRLKCSGIVLDTGKGTDLFNTVYYHKCLWECFNSQLAGGPFPIIFVDGNPYNTSKNNLLRVTKNVHPDVLRPAIENSIRFWKDTLNHVNLLKDKYKITDKEFYELFPISVYFREILQKPEKIENLEKRLRYIEEKSKLWHSKLEKPVRRRRTRQVITSISQESIGE